MACSVQSVRGSGSGLAEEKPRPPSPSPFSRPPPAFPSSNSRFHPLVWYPIRCHPDARHLLARSPVRRGRGVGAPEGVPLLADGLQLCLRLNDSRGSSQLQSGFAAGGGGLKGNSEEGNRRGGGALRPLMVRIRLRCSSSKAAILDSIPSPPTPASARANCSSRSLARLLGDTQAAEQETRGSQREYFLPHGQAAQEETCSPCLIDYIAQRKLEPTGSGKLGGGSLFPARLLVHLVQLLPELLCHELNPMELVQLGLEPRDLLPLPFPLLLPQLQV